MAYTNHEQLVSGVSGAATDQFEMVVLQADGKYDPAGAGVAVDGILASGGSGTGGATVDGDVVSIAIPNGGITRVLAGDAVSVGDNVTPDAAGKAVTATSTDVIVGKALEAASGSGSVIAIRFYGYAGVVA